MSDPIIIVGAGLSGLYAASLLTKHGIKYRVLEAKERIGGRVLSTPTSDESTLGQFDLGPTWFWPDYEDHIDRLVKDLNLQTFEQYTNGDMLVEQDPNQPSQRYVVPENSSITSMRVTGGIQSLVESVANTLPPEVIELEKRVTSIQLDEDDTITLEAKLANGMHEKITTSTVILALPPRIIEKHIEFSPAFPSELIRNLKSKPTWMAGQAKAIAIYEQPFWRELGLSGSVRSLVGPLQEIHDASLEPGPGALFGFFGMPATVRQKLSKDEILKLVTDQLVRLFGPSAANTSTILYKDWAEEPETAVAEDLAPLMDFPTYGPPPHAGIWENKIFFAGTEASSQYGGHLEGALQAADRAVTKMMNNH